MATFFLVKFHVQNCNLKKVMKLPSLQTCTDIGFYLSEEDWRTVRKKVASASDSGGKGTVQVGEFFAVLHQGRRISIPNLN